MSNSLQDGTFGRLEWDAGARRYVGRFEFRPHEPVEVSLALGKTGQGNARKLLRFARRQLAHMRRGEAGYRGYRRRAARELLRRRPGPKTAAAERRMAAALQLERLGFDDDGLSALYYRRAGSPDIQAAVAIDANGTVTLVDARTRSQVADARAQPPAAGPPARLEADPFGPLAWVPGEGRYTGRFPLLPGQIVNVSFHLSGNVEGDIRPVLAHARTQLGHMRRGEPRYRQRAATELVGRQPGVAPRRQGAATELAAALRPTGVEFGEDGESLLAFGADLPGPPWAVVQLGARGRVEWVEADWGGRRRGSAEPRAAPDAGRK